MSKSPIHGIAICPNNLFLFPKKICEMVPILPASCPSTLGLLFVFNGIPLGTRTHMISYIERPGDLKALSKLKAFPRDGHSVLVPDCVAEVGRSNGQVELLSDLRVRCLES